MTKKVCVIVSDCSACSGLSEEDMTSLKSLLLKDPLISCVVGVRSPCLKSARQELKKLSLDGCDRAVIAMWCPPISQGLGKGRILPSPVDPLLVELVNLSVMTQKDGKNHPGQMATALRSLVAKLSLAEPLKDRKMKFADPTVAVIGSGDWATQAAHKLVACGCKVRLITSGDAPPSESKDQFEIIANAKPEDISGFPGNFKIRYRRSGALGEVGVASLLLVSDRNTAEPRIPDSSQIRFVPLEKFSEQLNQMPKLEGIVFVDDLRAVDPSAPQVIPAWHFLLEAAKTAASASMAQSVSVLAREVRSTGLLELLWREAADSGVKFIRYDDKTMPRLSKDGRSIEVKDLVLGEVLSLSSDVVVAPTASRPWERLFVEKLFLPSDWDLRARQRGPQRGLAQSTCDGIFLLGYARYNEPFDIIEPELSSVIVEVLSFIRQGYYLARGAVAQIEEGKCSACNTCVRTCPYRAARMNDSWKAEIVSEKCLGCGNCVAVCPSRAIVLKNCTDEQIRAQMTASLQEVIP